MKYVPARAARAVAALPESSEPSVAPAAGVSSGSHDHRDPQRTCQPLVPSRRPAIACRCCPASSS
ncbi:hypothetical protein PSP6_800023 [Paraburkholderia tropica]|nr:hypothetical protein PSP6_800023 [Paraburkholderia tropica]